MQGRLNEIKDREDFRPVAPVVLEEEAPHWFAHADVSPFISSMNKLADQNLEIATEDAYAMARQLSRGAGLLVGVSSAAAVAGSLQIARQLSLKRGQEAVIVTVLCDSGDKYLSERFWTES